MGTGSNRRGVFGWVVAICAWPTLGHAEDSDEDAVSAPAAVYLPLGFTMGSSFFRETGLNVFLGGELSLVVLDAEWDWVGGYADALYDFGTDGVRSSFGVEFGTRYVGIDAGYVLDTADPEGLRHGVVVRPMLTTGLLSLSSRFGYLFTGRAQVFFEAGLLVKYPFDLDG